MSLSKRQLKHKISIQHNHSHLVYRQHNSTAFPKVARNMNFGMDQEERNSKKLKNAKKEQTQPTRETRRKE